MAIPVLPADCLRIILFGRFNGTVETRNVFYYLVDTVGATSDDADSLAGYARGLWETIKAELRAITSSQHRYYQVECGEFDTATGLVVAAETYAIPGGEQAGLVVDESLPPYATFTFRYIRSDINFRHGYKRFAGVPENMQAAGVITGGGGVLATALAVKLMADIIPWSPSTGLVGDGTADVRITRQEQNGSPVLPVLLNIPSTVVYSAIGTQNSRKLGRGV